MKILHTVTISVFIKPEDRNLLPDLDDKVARAFHLLMPMDFDAEKIFLRKELAEGFNNRTITIYKLQIIKEAHTNIFVKKLLKVLNNDQIDLLLRQIDTRLDDELNFYIRFGKQELLREDIFIIDYGDCFHLKLAVAAFPRNKAAAKEILNKIFIKK